MIISTFIAAAIGYVLGSLPFGYLVAKAKGVNIFEVGSKSPGATNVKRVLGAKAGNTVFALDAMKGIIAAATPLVFMLGGDPGTLGYELGGVAGVVGAVLGHSFSCFNGFRGGKGVATAAGGLFILMPIPCLWGAVAWVVTFYMFKYVSLASIVSAVVISIAPWAVGFSAVTSSVATVLGVLVIARHHANIRRLMAGREHRWDRK